MAGNNPDRRMRERRESSGRKQSSGRAGTRPVKGPARQDAPRARTSFLSLMDDGAAEASREERPRSDNAAADPREKRRRPADARAPRSSDSPASNASREKRRRPAGERPDRAGGNALAPRGSRAIRVNRDIYAPRKKKVFSRGGGLTSLLPKLIVAAAAIALVVFVVPKVFGAVTGLFDKDGESSSGTVEYVIPEPYVLNYEPSIASLASLPAAAEGVTGFTLVADETGYVPTMSADQQAAVQSVLDQYAPNNRTVGFVFVDLRTGSGYAYDVDADVYGASSFKAHVAVFACQNQVESGAVKQSAFRQSAETAVVWSDNDAYYRLRNASGAKTDAFRSWFTGMGLDPALADDTFPTYSAREAATLWMNSYLYLKSGDPSLTNWLAGLMSTTNVSMIRDGVSSGTKLDPVCLADSLVGEASAAVFDALPAGFMTAAAIEAAEEAEKSVKEGKGSAVATDGSEKYAAANAADAVREGIVDPSAGSDSSSASSDSASSAAEEKADPKGATDHLGFGKTAAGDVTPDIVVYNKAGWINGSSSDSTCDAGIIIEGDEAYLMCIMTSAPDSTGNRQLASDLAAALWAARDTLQPPGLVKA